MVAAISSEAAANPKLGGGNGNPRAAADTEKKIGSARIGNGEKQKPVRSRSVSSRYLSSSSTSTSNSTSSSVTTTTTSSSTSSRRYTSPLVSRSGNTAKVSSSSSSTAKVEVGVAGAGAGAVGLKRSQSVDRRRLVPSGRPVTAAGERRLSNAGEGLSGGGGGGSVAAKMLFTSSRSLSVSFQGESFSLPISKAKPAPMPVNVRKGTPERRRGTPVKGRGEVGGVGDQVENSRPGEQHRWPARSRAVNSLSRSIDYGGVENRAKVDNDLVKGLEHSVIGESKGDWFDGGRLSMDFGNARVCDTNSAHESSVPSDLTASDSDSVSSGSTSGLRDSNGGMSSQLRGGPRGSLVSAKFWQETNSRMRHLQDPGSPLSTSPGARLLGASKCFPSKRFSCDNPMMSPRTTPSPTRGGPRSASPSKFMMPSISYASRGNFSPSRSDSTAANYSNGSNGPSILSFSADLRRGKMADNLVVNAHLLRLLYNRQLQWRFINARSDATSLMQSRMAEKTLWNAWITISELRRSVTIKRTKLNMLRIRLKLTSILREQLPYLEEWFLHDPEHMTSILGAIEALKASILRLPVTGKAVVDIQNIKDAVRSAVDVMQAMISSLFSLHSKVEEMDSLVAELKNATAKEKALLAQCKDFLSMVAALQVKDCSMRTHTLQLNRDLTANSSTLTTPV